MKKVNNKLMSGLNVSVILTSNKCATPLLVEMSRSFKAYLNSYSEHIEDAIINNICPNLED